MKKNLLLIFVLCKYLLGDAQSISIQDKYFSIGDNKFYYCKDSNNYRDCDTNYYLNKFIAILGAGRWDSRINFKKFKKTGNYIVNYNYPLKGITLEASGGGKDFKKNALVQSVIVNYSDNDLRIQHDVSIYNYRFIAPPRYEDILNGPLKQYINARLKKIDDEKLTTDNFKDLSLLTPSDILIELTFKRDGDDFYLYSFSIFQFL